MIDPSNSKLSVNKQCNLLSLCRSSYYYSPDNTDSETDVILKKEIQKVYTLYPQYGYRKVTIELNHNGFTTTTKKTRNLMKKLGLQAIYPKPRLSVANKKNKKYPYLLRDLKIDHCNQVWATDITYIKLPGGNVYLAAIIDVFSRKILAWGISNTQDSSFCVEILKEALAKYGNPNIFNTDQGSQYTSSIFTKELLERSILISMDGKGRALDNIYIERFWRTIKYENIFLNDYQTLNNLKQGVEDYMKFYNSKRWHQSLNYSTPDVLYFGVV